jgi:quinoprotein glucose dehydrogenase
MTSLRRGVIAVVILGALVAVTAQQRRSPDADWPTYNRDLAGTRYSRLTQINTKNVAALVPAWSYRLRPEPGRAVPAIDKPASSFELFQQVTPIVVNGVMYLPSGNHRTLGTKIGGCTELSKRVHPILHISQEVLNECVL